LKQLTLLFIFLAQFAFSQTKFKGIIKDEKNNPIPFANVLIRPENSQLIAGFCQSDKNGYYQLKTNKIGKHLLCFSSMSCKTVIIPVELKNEPNEIVTDVVLTYDTIELNEIVVSVQRPITIKKDTIIFDAKAFSIGNEKVVEDLLKRIPGLSISENGSIKVGNQEVEKVMVDGDDFFEKGYRLLTKNMPANPIDKIEVLQHYSNNKLLKGIENSEKVALNLKLNEDAKRLWFGNISVGYDPVAGNKFDAFCNLMNFGKKNKYYFLTNLNNIGEDATGNINYLIRPSETDESVSIGENQNAQKIIDMSTISPNLKQERLLFNNAKILSLNGIYAILSKVKLKTLGFLNTDENNYFENRFQSISIGETTFQTKEDQQLRKTKITGFGKIDLTGDISKNQSIVFTGKFNRTKEDDRNSLVFNDIFTNEKLKSNNTFFDQKIVYTNKLQKNKILLLTGRYINEKTPQLYSFDKYFFNDLFPTVSDANWVSQSNENQMQFAGFETLFMDRKSNGNLLEVQLGNQFRKDDLNSTFALNLDEINISQPLDYQNNIVYSTNDFYLNSKYLFKFKRFGLIPGLELHQMFNHLKNSGNAQSQSPFFINPKVGLNWEVNNKNKILTTYSYNKTNASVLDVYDRYIQTGFRTFSKGTGNFNQLNATTISLVHTFGSWGDKSFANTLLMFNKNHDFFSTNSIVSKNFFQTEKILTKDKMFVILSSSFDRYFKIISSNVKLNFGLSLANYKNIVNNSELRNVTTNNFNYGFELRSSFQGFFNYHLGSKWNNNEVVTIFCNTSYTDNMSFFDLSFVFGSKFDLELQSERYFFGSLDKNSNQYYFLDLDARYMIKENKLSISLSGQNLFNTKTFRSYSIDDISVSKTEYRLLPRYVLLKVEFRF
jgi:hypothetical protein